MVGHIRRTETACCRAKERIERLLTSQGLDPISFISFGRPPEFDQILVCTDIVRFHTEDLLVQFGRQRKFTCLPGDAGKIVEGRGMSGVAAKDLFILRHGFVEPTGLGQGWSWTGLQGWSGLGSALEIAISEDRCNVLLGFLQLPFELAVGPMTVGCNCG